MKIERLIGIILVLLHKQKVTSSYLADRFGVSKRTIYRDITDLCLAGIPVTTCPGIDGGIQITDDYKINKPFWSDACPVKTCCENRKKEHCGKYKDFPCALLTQFSYDEKQGDDGKRIRQCQKWCNQ